MKFSNLTKSFFMLSGIFLNIVFRWPKHGHEIGMDSFFIHSLSNSISHHGRANWIANPYSYLGLTPGTYPSGVPYLLSGLSQLSGCTLEMTILLFSCFLGVFGFFTSYLLARLFFTDDRICLLLAFAFSTAPIFISFTIWTTSTRALFVTLLPIFLYLLIRTIKKQDIRLVILIIVLFIVEYSIHHMGVLLVGVVVTFLFSKFVFYKIVKVNKIILRTALFVILSISLFFLYLQVTNFWIYKDVNIKYAYQSGFLLSGDSYLVILSNMFIDYGSKYGLIYLLALVGLVYLSYVSFIQRFNLKQILLLSITVSFVPILLLGTYNAFFLLTIFTLFLGYGSEWVLRNRRTVIKRSVPILIGVLLVSTLFFSMFMIDHWHNSARVTGTYDRSESWHYDTALYLNENNMNNNLVSNTWEQVFVNAYSSTPPKYSEPRNQTLTAGSFKTLIIEDAIYVAQIRNERTLFSQRNWTEIRMEHYITTNEPTMMINNRIPTQRANSGVIYNSTMIQELPKYKYKIYDTKELSIYNL